MITPTALFLLRWIVPPVLGAVAGYILVLIVQRLFVGRRGSSPAASALAGGVGSFSSRMLATPVSSLLGADGAGGFLRGLLGSRAVIYAVRELVSQAVHSLFGTKTADALSRFGVEGLLADRVLGALSSPEKNGAISRSLAEALVDNSGTLLDDPALDRAASVAEGFAPVVVERLVQWVRSPRTRSDLSERGRDLVPRILEKLNVVQRLLISAGQYDRRVAEKMPEIVDETIASLEAFLRDPAEQRGIIGALRDSLKDWRAALAGPGRENGIDRITGAIEGLLGRLSDPSVRHRVAALVCSRLAASWPTIGAVSRDLLGVGDTEAVERLSALALTVLTGPGASASVQGALGPMLDMPLGELLGVDGARKKRIDEALVSRILDTLDSRPVRKPMRWLRALGAGLGLLVGIVELFLRLVVPSL